MRFSKHASPLVSIIVPYYEHSSFIESCLNSISLQTYGNIEIIVVDDCSPDGSGKFVSDLIDRYNKQTPRLICSAQFHQFSSNCGAHAAINYGIHRSHGDILTILNSDDIYHSERIRLAVKEIQEKNVELLFTQIGYIDENGCDIKNFNETALRFFDMQKGISGFPTVGFSCLASNVAITTGNLVFTRELYEKVGEFRSFRYCHDWDFLLRAVLETEPVFLNQELYLYRLHGKNTFESAQSIAVQECNAILYRYLGSARQKTANPLAPTARNWPTLFDLFLDLWKYSDIDRRVTA